MGDSVGTFREINFIVIIYKWQTLVIKLPITNILIVLH